MLFEIRAGEARGLGACLHPLPDGFRTLDQQRRQQAAGASAKVGEPEGAILGQAVQRGGHHALAVAPRNESAGIGQDVESVEMGFAHDVLGRLTGGAAFNGGKEHLLHHGWHTRLACQNQRHMRSAEGMDHQHHRF